MTRHILVVVGPRCQGPSTMTGQFLYRRCMKRWVRVRVVDLASTHPRMRGTLSASCDDDQSTRSWTSHAISMSCSGDEHLVFFLWAGLVSGGTEVLHRPGRLLRRDVLVPRKERTPGAAHQGPPGSS